jgi:uncharacterized membrane protein
MVLIRTILLVFLILTASGVSHSPPAAGHENHKKAKASQAPPSHARMAPSAMQEQMEEHVEEMEAQEPKSMSERLISWFGRMHPFAVHFPIALFPVALVALVFARRRGETVELIRALIVVAGAGAVVGAVLGWLNGGLTIYDTDTVLMLHRWLGTALGLFGGVVGWWAWRRRASVHSGRMVSALGVIVALLLLQGFLGASVTHGWEHMMI